MSFLSILLVASAFYFAHARPDAGIADGAGEIFTGPILAMPPVEPKDLSEYQQQLNEFMQDMGKAVEDHMTPLMSKLDVTKQEELKTMGMNGFASYVNYLLLLIQEMENKEEKGESAADHDDSQPRNEMILEFDSPYPVNPEWPFIAEIPLHEVEKEA